VDVCPVECIIVDPAHTETHDQLELKYRHLMALGGDAGASPSGASTKDDA